MGGLPDLVQHGQQQESYVSSMVGSSLQTSSLGALDERHLICEAPAVGGSKWAAKHLTG